MLLEQGVPQSSCEAGPPCLPDSKHRTCPRNSVCRGVYDDPQPAESGEEFVQNIPLYVEEIGRWWTGVVRFAAKYNIVLPEYAIDSDLLIEKVTALISDEGSGILTVTWGAATSVLSALVDVLLGLVFALYLLAKKEVVAAHFEKACCDSPSDKKRRSGC